MSHSPERRGQSARRYLAGWRASAQLLREGRSWSGRERHCAFLNLGHQAQRFADISAVTGLDFADDGRALAVVDWDHDGDLDLWLANRTAPRLRLMLNQSRGTRPRLTEQDAARKSKGQDAGPETLDRGFVALRLQGKACNRDAIGARVTLVSNPQFPNRKSVTTLRAGEGFLSQSSKWLHFGLGEGDLSGVTVRWPGGTAEQFQGVARNGRYLLEQGAGRAVPWQQPGAKAQKQRTVALAAALQNPPERSGSTRIWMPAPIPLPTLRYQSLQHDQTMAVTTHGRPLLLNLWASWCLPCAAELKRIADDADALRGAGIDVLALSLDGLDTEHDSNTVDAARLITRLEFPFATGAVLPETLGKLDVINGFLFDRPPTLGVPTSLLLDRQGALAVIYRGPVELETLQSDVALLSSPDAAQRDRSAPFAGRWHFPLGQLDLKALADLFQEHHPADAARYIAAHVRIRPDDASAHYQLSRLLTREGNHVGTIHHLRRAVRLTPDALAPLNDLAWHLATGPTGSAREQEEAVRAAEHAAQLTRHSNPGILDTLAAAYAAAGRFDEAATTAETAVLLASKANRADIAQAIQRRLELYRKSQRFREHSALGGVN